MVNVSNMQGEVFKNTYQHQKMMVQKNIGANKKMMKKTKTGVMKPNLPKRKGKKSVK